MKTLLISLSVADIRREFPVLPASASFCICEAIRLAMLYPEAGGAGGPVFCALTLGSLTLLLSSILTTDNKYTATSTQGFTVN